MRIFWEYDITLLLNSLRGLIKLQYNINLMQAKTPQSLVFHQSCTQLSTNKQKTHKGIHQTLSYPVLTQLIQQSSSMNKDFYPFDCFYKDILDILNALKLKIDQVISNVSKDVEKCRCQLGLGLKSKEEINGAVEISKGEKGNLENIRCCDVYQIFIRVSQFGENKYNGALIQHKINTLANNIVTQLTQYIKPIEKLIVQSQSTNQQKQSYKKQQSTTKNPTTNSKSSGKIQQPVRTGRKVQQTHQEQQDQYQQSRPSRQTADRRPRVNNGTSQKLKKISQLDKTTKEIFTVRIKILRIVKYFQINGTKKVQFKAGDETGTSSCVMNKNDLIIEGNTIEVTNCRVYLFKGKICQIQSERNSVYTKVEAIKRVGEDYDFTDPNRRNQNQRNRRENYYDQGEKFERHHSERDRKNSSQQRSQHHQNQHQHQYQPQYQPQYQKQQPIKNQPIKKQPPKIPTGCIKICSIEPDSENISMIAKIYKVIDVQNSIVTCYLGDETGIVRAQLPSINFVKEGNSVLITNFDAKVVFEHILVKFNKFSKVQLMNLNFPIVKLDNDMSQQAWVEEPEEEEDEAAEGEQDEK